MALQIWLPLNGNLNNQGLSNITVTNSGATVDNNGKIGKCYLFNGSSKLTNTLPSTVSSSVGTLACWVKFTSLPGSGGFYNLLQLGNLGGYATCRFGIYMEYTNRINISIDGSDVNTNAYTHSLVANQWYHICATNDGTTVKLYIDGTEVLSKAVTKGSYTTAASNLFVGGTSAYYLNGRMNDARYYDRALAPKEIEILSRGLVCHYPLNNNGGGQPNLYDFESVASKWAEDGLTRSNYTDDVYGNVLKVSSGSTQSSNFRIYREVSNVWNSGQTYTVSFLAKASKSATVRVSRSVADYAPNFTVGTTWKRYSGQINCTTTATGGTLSIQLATLSTDLYITQVKLELGDKVTAYQPGVGDSHYIPLGYDSTTEYDVSGYNYNGTRNGTFSWKSDTPRYLVSSVFTNSNANHISLGSQTLNMSNVTFSVWFKVNTAYQWSRIFDFGALEGVGYCIGLALGSNGTTLTLYGRRGSASATLPDKQIQSISLNTWYHVAISISGATCNCYVNGELKVSHNFTTAYPENTTFNYCYVGKSVYSADKALDGQVSDFRIYATALSDTQIAELYNTAVSVANNGTLMGYELVEV